jgi:aminopeptidase YwaD
MDSIFEKIIVERPIGTESNEKVTEFLQGISVKMGYHILSLKFDCYRWEKGESFIEFQGNRLNLLPSPFSDSFIGEAELVKITTLDELHNCYITGKIALLDGILSKEPLMPKDFPFYYPDEHKAIIDLFEDKKPKAIIAITNKHPMCGLNPFPLFEDGNFSIPSAYISRKTGEKIINNANSLHINLISNKEKSSGRQIIASTKGQKKGKIVICAHMDTKYGTLGAIDNAAGVDVLFQIMKNLQNYDHLYDFDFVPFNGEEYYGVNGQLEYLKFIETQKTEIKLVINIDSPGHIDSKTAISTYNFTDNKNKWINEKIANNPSIVRGSEWVAGDHAVFAFQGIPCIAVTSSNLFDTVLELTHTPNDTIENIEKSMLNETSLFLTELIKDYND